MAQEKVKSTTIPLVGYNYQLLQGIDLLCDWLDSPCKYLKIYFECDDPGVAEKSLDDIVALREDQRYDYYQVKYTTDPEKHKLTWSWLLESGGKTARARSNIKKWFDGINRINVDKLGDVKLLTNRIPDRDIEYCLDGGGFFKFDKISPEIKSELISALGGEEKVIEFFSRIKICHSDKRYFSLENKIKNRLLKHTDENGFARLFVAAGKWLSFRGNDISEDGWISLEKVKKIISYLSPEKISEDFIVPENYRSPSDDFNNEFIATIEGGNESIICLSGPPGRGKSTYLSFIYNELKSKEIPVIRHHYFLSNTDRTTDRYSPYIVFDSLIRQIKDLPYPCNEQEGIAAVLEGAALYYRTQNKPFVVIIDGLDHVWRENFGDTKPLDELFRQLIPVSDNMVLIIGTQPVTDAWLPERLLSNCPKQNWKELPAMSTESVLHYLQTQINCGRLKLRTNIQAELSDSAGKLREITGGHPLHVIYATEYIVNNVGWLSVSEIEQIPDDLSKGVEEYYGSLWHRLTYVQRDILLLLTDFSFYWPESCLVSGEILPLEVNRDVLSTVVHLLYRSVAGLTIFHDSLSVFVRNTLEFKERQTDLSGNVESWLTDKAPIHLRKMWLWHVQARNGKPENLISGITRNWLMELLSSGYGSRNIAFLIAEAEKQALKLSRYADVYRLQHLKWRLLDNPDFQIGNLARLKNCSWQFSSEEILKEAIADYSKMEITELLSLALVLRNNNILKTNEKESVNKAIELYKDKFYSNPRSLLSDDFSFINMALGVLGFLNSDKIVAENFDVSDTLLSESVIEGIASRANISELLVLHGKLSSPDKKKIIENAITRIAILKNIPINSQEYFQSFENSEMVGCIAQISGIKLETRINSQHRTIDIEEYPYRQQKLNLFVHEYFFHSLLKCLTSKSHDSEGSDYNILPKDYIEYFDLLSSHAQNIAIRWLKGEIIGFSDFFVLFDGLSKPGHDYHRKRRYDNFIAALIPIAFDCQLISTLRHNNSRQMVGAADLIQAEKTGRFSMDCIREWYATAKRTKFLSDDGAMRIIEHGNNVLSSLQETCFRSKILLELCEVALLHGFKDKANRLNLLCWESVCGYVHRKDSTIISLLKAIRRLSEVKPDLAMKELKEIAPQIHHITDYTDGDGTRRSHNYANKLLAKFAPLSLADKYSSHIYNGKWYMADDVLRDRCNANLDSSILKNIARTGLSEDVMEKIYELSMQKNQKATELLEIANKHNGIIFFPKEESDTGLDYAEPIYSPEDYPPDKLNSFLSDIKNKHSYLSSGLLSGWYEFWRKKGKDKELLEAVELILQSNKSQHFDFWELGDFLFESSLSLRGPEAAFPYIIKSQMENNGWSDFQGFDEKAKYCLKRVKEVYPDRIDDFIRESCFGRFSKRQSVEVRILIGYKLVDFLIELGRTEEAISLVKAMREAVKGDTCTLPLKIPEWSNYNTSEVDLNIIEEADIRLLLERSRWPVPNVKWWSMQEMADLLLDAKFREKTEKALYAAMENAKLETELIEFLFVFWLAKQKGYCPSSANIIPCIRARSVLSDMLIPEMFDLILYEGEYSSPLVKADSSFQAEIDSSDAQGRMVPIIFLNFIKDLESRFEFPLISQYQFEWENNKDFYPNQQSFNSFYNKYHSDFLIWQFASTISHRDRSAYLRLLSVAKHFGGIPFVSI
jgi:hypothetical protein